MNKAEPLKLTIKPTLQENEGYSKTKGLSKQPSI
jgi:hypothetical protein